MRWSSGFHGNQLVQQKPHCVRVELDESGQGSFTYLLQQVRLVLAEIRQARMSQYLQLFTTDLHTFRKCNKPLPIKLHAYQMRVKNLHVATYHVFNIGVITFLLVV